jgi:hypothetical protein
VAAAAVAGCCATRAAWVVALAVVRGKHRTLPSHGCCAALLLVLLLSSGAALLLQECRCSAADGAAHAGGVAMMLQHCFTVQLECLQQ